MQNQVEVRQITKKISDLNCKLDTVSTLSEPRENAYILYVLAGLADTTEPDGNVATAETDDEAGKNVRKVSQILRSMGQIKTSKTFPSLCRATMETAIANLEMVARITTIDYNGVVQVRGGDPVNAEIVDDAGSKVPLTVEDKDDGTYEVKFTAHRPGTFCLKVNIKRKTSILIKHELMYRTININCKSITLSLR